MLYLSIGSVICAVIIFLLAIRQRRKAGIPYGKLIYADSSQWMNVEKPLFDGKLRLTGKPDYLVKQGKSIIPVEVKSGRSPHQPHAWHIYQLAAYCLLTEHEYGIRPPHGILHYADRTFAVNFTTTLESTTLATIREMQKRASQIQIERSHYDSNRCLHCGYRSRCDQALRI